MICNLEMDTLPMSIFKLDLGKFVLPLWEIYREMLCSGLLCMLCLLCCSFSPDACTTGTEARDQDQ